MRLAVPCVVAALTFAAPAAAAPRCPVPAGASVLARTASSVVWSAPQPHGAGPVWRGCSVRSGRTVRLEASDEPLMQASVERVRLKGRYAAYVDTSFDHYGAGNLWLVVVDLAGPGRWSVLLASTGFDGPPFGLAVTGLAVSGDGALAWRPAAAQDAQLDSPDAAVRDAHDSVGISDSRGSAIVSVAPSGSIGAFRLRQGVLTWTTAGAPHARSLHGHPPRRCALRACWRSA